MISKNELKQFCEDADINFSSEVEHVEAFNYVDYVKFRYHFEKHHDFYFWLEVYDQDMDFHEILNILKTLLIFDSFFPNQNRNKSANIHYGVSMYRNNFIKDRYINVDNLNIIETYFDIEFLTIEVML